MDEVYNQAFYMTSIFQHDTDNSCTNDPIASGTYCK